MDTTLPISPDSAEGSSVRCLHWAHGTAELQALGGMLAPVVFRAAGAPDFQPLQVAPWADEPGNPQLPGLMRRLRGEWPCVPFGRTDRPAGLPADWARLDPGDAWGHGYAAHHDWQWLDDTDALTLALAIDLPPDQPVARLERRVRALPDAPALELSLVIHASRACVLPVALHPTLRLDAGRVQLRLPGRGAGHTYPVPAEPGASRVAAGAAFDSLAAVPLAGGGQADFSRYPQAADGEDLLLLTDAAGTAQADFLDASWSLSLEWDSAQLPDLMLWVSHRGRRYPPWNGRHWALGVEPVNGLFDLGRVAAAPAGHPLADRRGLALSPDRPTVVRSRLHARPLPAKAG